MLFAVKNMTARSLFHILLLSCCLVVLTLTLLYRPPQINGSGCAVSNISRLAVLVYFQHPKDFKHAIDLVRLIVTTTSSQRCSSVRLTNFLFLPEGVSKSSVADFKDVTIVREKSDDGSYGMSFSPCKILLENAADSLFFDTSKYDFIVTIEASVKFGSNIAVARAAFLSERLAVMHPSLPKIKRSRLFAGLQKNDQTNKSFSQTSWLHYSSKLFGGSSSSVRTMCDKIVASPGICFHRKLNEFFRNAEPPTAVLLPNGILDFDKFEGPAELRRLGYGLILPPPDATELEYLKAIDEDNEQKQFSLFQLAADRIADAIRRNYVAKVHQLFMNAHQQRQDKSSKNATFSTQQFVASTCTIAMGGDCGGFGDRLRGLVVSLYLAIATDRVFHVEQTKPIDFALYFCANDCLYDVPSEFYAKQRNESLAKSHIMRRMGAEKDFVEMLDGVYFDEMRSKFLNIGLLSNRYTGLASLFGNKKFSSLVGSAVEYDVSTAGRSSFDYPVFISAALRVALERMSERLHRLFNAVITSTVGFNKWHDSVRIGIQIRVENMANFSLDKAVRVQPNQIACFAKKVKSIIGKIKTSTVFSKRSSNIIVFVTTDWPESIKLFEKHLQGVTIFTTDERQNLTIAHVDQKNEAANDVNGWQLMAKSYLDWFILTKMDFLVISRSGFGETASMMSLKPTWRFYHWIRETAGHQNCAFMQYNVFMPDVVSVEKCPLEFL